MSNDTERSRTGQGLTPADRRVLAYVLFWAVGAWLSRHLGVWIAVGSTATLLGVFAAWSDGARLLGQGRHLRLWPAGLLAGLLMAGATLLLFEPVTTLFPGLRSDVEALYEAFRVPGTQRTLLLMPVVVVLEEFVWRGAVHNALTRRMSGMRSAAVGAGLYALAHVPVGSPALVLACIGAGFCWAVLRARTDSLPTVQAAHLTWDFTILVFFQLTPAG